MRHFIFIFSLLLSATTYSQRIITAGSAITETVCALGDCDKIIASDKTSLYPATIQQLPSIGYRSSITSEGIISLKPTLIIAEKNYVEDAVLKQLEASGIKLVIIDRKYAVDDTKKFIAQIGDVLNRKEEAKKLIASINAELEEVKALVKKSSSTPKVLCVYNRGTATISAGGTETFADITPLAGGVNAFNNIDGYKPLNTESLIAANPDYLLFLSSGLESLGGVDGALKVQGVAQTTAGKKRQIISLDSLMLTNFGPRIGKAVKELVLLLHPELQTK